MPPRENLAGQRFTFCRAVGPAPSIGGRTRWNMQCDCGRLFVARTRDLKNDDVKSCGCMKHITRYRHPIKVPGPKDSCHPLVKELWRRMAIEQATAEEVSERAGPHATTIRNWRTSRDPRLSDFCAAVGALGGRVLIRWNEE